MSTTIESESVVPGQSGCEAAAPLMAGLSPLGGGRDFADQLYGAMAGAALFTGLERPEIDLLSALMDVYDAPAGLTLIHEGESGDFMILLVGGQVEVVRRNRANVSARIAVAEPGNTLGEMSLFDGQPRFASCITLAPTRFARLDQRAMMAFLDANPGLGRKVLLKLVHMLSDRLRQTSARLVSLIDAVRSETN
jgi:CRP/FNR family cyclic AMP-dependent transcriptional regulator